MMVAFANKHEQ